MEGLKIEVGKKYILRNGFSTLKVKLSGCGTNYKYHAGILNDKNERTGYLFSWLNDGSFLIRTKEHRFDIVKEMENE